MSEIPNGLGASVVDGLQLPGEDPAPADAAFVLTAPDSDLPNARVAASSATVAVNVSVPGVVTFDVPDATTAAKGVVELANDAESAAGLAVQANDSRLSNARTPTAHAATHLDGGGDAIAAATTSARGIVELATDGESASGVAVQGNDSRIAQATICMGANECGSALALSMESTSRVPYRAIPDGVTSVLSWTVTLPPRPLPAGGWTLRVRWAGLSDAGVPTGNVRFSYNIRRWVDTEAFNVLNATSFSVTVATVGTDNQQQTDSLVTGSTIDGAQPGDTITVTVRRLGADAADTFAGAVQLLSVELLAS